MFATLFNYLFPRVRFIVQVGGDEYFLKKGCGTTKNLKKSWKHTMLQLRQNPLILSPIVRGQGKSQQYLLDADNKSLAVWFSFDRKHSHFNYRRFRWFREWQADHGIKFRCRD